MAIVRVERVILAPTLVGDLTGSDVTVYTADGSKVAIGDRAIFLAESWQYGRNVGVVEIGRLGDIGWKDARELILGERLRYLDDLLQQHVDKAELVVSGRVLETEAASPDGRPDPEGNEWWDAQIRVSTIERGRPPMPLWVRYPLHGEREWDAAPRFFPGQEGIWLLTPWAEVTMGDQRGADEKRDPEGWKNNRRPWAALDPLDFHGPAELARIQTLVWRQPVGEHRGPRKRGR